MTKLRGIPGGKSAQGQGVEAPKPVEPSGDAKNESASAAAPAAAPQVSFSPEQKEQLDQIAISMFQELRVFYPDIPSDEVCKKLTERVMNEMLHLPVFLGSRLDENQPDGWGVQAEYNGQRIAVVGPKRPSAQSEVGQILTSAFIMALASSPVARAFLHLNGVRFSFGPAQLPSEKRILL